MEKESKNKEIKIEYANQDTRVNTANEARDVSGVFQSATSIPNGNPVKFINQIIPVKIGNNYYFYWYDMTNKLWKYTKDFSSISESSTGFIKSTNGVLSLENITTTTNPACKVHSSATVNLTSGVETTIGWNVEDFDDSNMHNSGANTLILVPSDGKYFVSTTVALNNATAFDINIKKSSDNSIITTTRGSGGFYAEINTTMSLTASDGFYITVTPLSATTTLNNTYSSFSVFKIS